MTFPNERIQSRQKLKIILDQAKSEGKKIVFTNGCFDLLHQGHIGSSMPENGAGKHLSLVASNQNHALAQRRGWENSPLRIGQ